MFEYPGYEVRISGVWGGEYVPCSWVDHSQSAACACLPGRNSDGIVVSLVTDRSSVVIEGHEIKI